MTVTTRVIGPHLRVMMVNKYYYPPHLGGVETVVRTLSEGLVELGGAQVTAVVSNEGSDRVEEVIAGVRVVRVPRRFAVSSAPIAMGMAWALRQELGRAGNRDGAGDFLDVVNLHSPYPWGELSFLLARLGAPSVTLYHSDIVRQKRLLAAYRPFLERFLDKVDLIVTSSPNIISGSELLGARATKCRVVPFGLPARRLNAAPGALRRAAELRAAHSGRRIVLFVGRLVYYKGVDVLVRAMKQVNADLVVIGQGPYEAEIRRLASASDVAARLAILPPQDEDELTAWYHAADVLCLPSVARSEAFGLVQIEAHAAGTPVVSTNLPTGVPFANLDGVTGLIVPHGDSGALAAALARLLSDDELRMRLGHQAQTRARREFTISRMVAGTLDVYAEAIERHHCSGRVPRGADRGKA